jgi:hypothetical protein
MWLLSFPSNFTLRLLLLNTHGTNSKQNTFFISLYSKETQRIPLKEKIPQKEIPHTHFYVCVISKVRIACLSQKGEYV